MNFRDIDAAALHAAKNPRYVIVANLGGTQSPSQNANQVGSYYTAAGNNLINSTGSPAATTFGNEEAASLKPQFANQDQNLAAQEAAMGITSSGAAKNDFSNLQGQQSATLAGAIAPLYESAIGSYGGLQGQGAGAQSSAYMNTYDQQQQAYQAALGDIGGLAGDFLGVPSIPSTSSSAPNYNPYGTGDNWA